LWKKITADKVDKDSSDMTTTKKLLSDYCEYSICVFPDVGIGNVHQKILMEENLTPYLISFDLLNADKPRIYMFHSMLECIDYIQYSIPTTVEGA